MMYPYLTLDDETEIVHSEMLSDNTVKVYIEKPDEKDGFHCRTFSDFPRMKSKGINQSSKIMPI